MIVPIIKRNDLGQQELKFEKPEDLLNAVNEYFAWVDSFNPVDKDGKTTVYKSYLITGLCDYIGIHRSTFDLYGTREGFKFIVHQAKQKIETFTVGFGLTSRTNALMSLGYMNNNFGWKQNFNVQPESPVETLDARDIKRMLDESKTRQLN